jgi:hypothetical protein
MISLLILLVKRLTASGQIFIPNLFPAFPQALERNQSKLPFWESESSASPRGLEPTSPFLKARFYKPTVVHEIFQNNPTPLFSQPALFRVSGSFHEECLLNRFRGQRPLDPCDPDGSGTAQKGSPPPTATNRTFSS